MVASLEKRVWRALRDVEWFEEGSSIFSDDDADKAYFVDGTQVANLGEPGDNQLGLRLTRQVISAHRPRLKSDPRVDLRRSGSDWIIVSFDSTRDIPFIVELAELAAGAHRPPGDRPPKSPPTGADLARRRKFH